MVSGEFRWFDAFKRTFEENLQPALKEHNVHYFTHLWNHDLERLKDFTDLCHPAIVELEDQRSFTEISKYFDIRKKLNSSILYQSFGAHKAFLLLDKYQKETNINFDLFIKMRPDLAFLDKIELDNFDQSSVYVKDIAHWRPVSNYINDYIYFTKNYEAVKGIASLGYYMDALLAYPKSYIYQKDESKNIYCPEEILAKHYSNLHITPKTYPFNIDLARHH